MADDEIKNTSNSKYGLYDHALPCEGEETRVYYIDQICHICHPNHAYAAGYPLNNNYELPAARVLKWDIPYNQMKGDFREISYGGIKAEVNEEHPVSPKGGPSVLPDVSREGRQYTLARRSKTRENVNQSTASTASDNSNPSKKALYPQRLQVSHEKGGRHQTASKSVSSEERVRVAAPEPFKMHPGDTFFDSY